MSGWSKQQHLWGSLVRFSGEFNALAHKCGDALSLCVLKLKEGQIVFQSRIENSKAYAVVKIQSMPNLVVDIWRVFHAHMTWRIDGISSAPYCGDGFGSVVQGLPSRACGSAPAGPMQSQAR